MEKKDVQDDVLEKIFIIAQSLVVFDSVDEVFEHIVKTATKITSSEAATIRIFNIKTGMLDIQKGYGLSEGFLSQPPIKLGEGIVGRVVLDGRHFMTTDVRKVPHCIHKELAALEGIKAVMSVPMKLREKSIGCVTVYRKTEEPFSEHEFLLLNIFASQVTETIEKARLIEELKEQATYDYLTRVLNKRALFERLETELRSSLRHGYPLSCIFIDIDNFKVVNDTQGHLIGDKLLREFAKVIKDNLRSTDIIGRFGGEEFIVVANYTDKPQALALAQRLKDATEKYNFSGREGYVHITFSAGVSSAPEDGDDVEGLIRKADETMLESKRKGKSCISVC